MLKKILAFTLILFILFNCDISSKPEEEKKTEKVDDSSSGKTGTETGGITTPENPETETGESITPEKTEIVLEPYKVVKDYDIVITQKMDDFEFGKAYNEVLKSSCEYCELDDFGLCNVDIRDMYHYKSFNSFAIEVHKINDFHGMAWSGYFGKAAINSTFSLLDHVYEDVYFRMLLSKKTLNYLRNFTFPENSYTEYYGLKSLGRLKHVVDYDIKEELSGLSNEQFTEKYGNCYSHQIREGLLLFEIVTYEVDVNASVTPSTIFNSLSKVKEATEEEAKEILKDEIEVPGVTKYIYTHSSFNDLPDGVEVNYNNLSKSMFKDGEFRNELYSVAHISFSDYWFID